MKLTLIGGIAVAGLAISIVLLIYCFEKERRRNQGGSASSPAIPN